MDRAWRKRREQNKNGGDHDRRRHHWHLLSCSLAGAGPSAKRALDLYSICRCNPGVGPDRLCLVGALPAEFGFGAAEMAERRRLLVDRPSKVECLDDRLWRQLEVPAHDLADLVVVDQSR